MHGGGIVAFVIVGVLFVLVVGRLGRSIGRASRMRDWGFDDPPGGVDPHGQRGNDGSSHGGNHGSGGDGDHGGESHGGSGGGGDFGGGGHHG
jgi:hypothetical protein